MKSRSRPATTCVIEPSAKYSVKTGPPRTDEIDLPFAGFVHVTVNARSTCQRSRTTLPASSRYCQTVKMPSEWTCTGKPQMPIVLRAVDRRVRHDVRRGGEGGGGERERAEDGGDEESQEVLLSRGMLSYVQPL